MCNLINAIDLRYQICLIYVFIAMNYFLKLLLGIINACVKIFDHAENFDHYRISIRFLYFFMQKKNYMCFAFAGKLCKRPLKGDVCILHKKTVENIKKINS